MMEEGATPSTESNKASTFSSHHCDEKLSQLGILAQREVPRILLDTDAGLDDAGALFMVLEAHKQGRINLTAITTTYGNTALVNVNKNVLRILQACDLLDIPVYSGAQSPLVLPFLQQDDEPFHGHDGFGNSFLPHPPLDKYIQKKSAVVKIVEEAQNSQGRLRLLVLGPLTNVALAKKIEPKLLCQLASLHIMGGNTTAEGNISACGEFNFACDPEAAQIVLSNEDRAVADTQPVCKDTTASAEVSARNTEVHEPCPVHVTPWETCLRAVHLPYSYREELGKTSSPQARLLNAGEASILASKRFQEWITCDQLSAAWMLDHLLGDSMWPETERASYRPLLTEALQCRVTVELQGTHTRGQMVLDRQKNICYSLPVTILTGVNELAYKRYLAMAFGREF